jgi:hypothetical protein
VGEWDEGDSTVAGLGLNEWDRADDHEIGVRWRCGGCPGYSRTKADLSVRIFNDRFRMADHVNGTVKSSPGLPQHMPLGAAQINAALFSFNLEDA